MYTSLPFQLVCNPIDYIDYYDNFVPEEDIVTVKLKTNHRNNTYVIITSIDYHLMFTD